MTQIEAARRAANEVRSRRAELRRAMKGPDAAAGIRRLAELLADCPPWLERMPIGDLLLYIPGVGPEAAGQHCASAGCSYPRPTGLLTMRQVERVRALLFRIAEDRDRAAAA